MKKSLSLILCLAMLFSFSSCSSSKGDDNKVVIYSSAEDYRNKTFQDELTKKFPNYKITIEYMSTGNQAAKILAEGESTACDISVDMEYGYVPKIEKYFADLSSYDTNIFMDDMLYSNKKILPSLKNSGCIAINKDVLKKKNIPVPKSYEDLLNPVYKDLISMPSPKTSGTGYMFLKSLVNAWGEEKAFEYFEKLAPNVLQFTSSGSGPVNALTQGEAAIGLAMIGQTVLEINKGVKLEIVDFDEGCPFTSYGIAMIKGKDQDKAVKEIFDYFYTTLIPLDKELYLPEKIYKDKDFTIKNYPTNIKYADMKDNTATEKERLLLKWKY